MVEYYLPMISSQYFARMLSGSRSVVRQRYASSHVRYPNSRVITWTAKSLRPYQVIIKYKILSFLKQTYKWSRNMKYIVIVICNIPSRTYLYRLNNNKRYFAPKCYIKYMLLIWYVFMWNWIIGTLKWHMLVDMGRLLLQTTSCSFGTGMCSYVGTSLSTYHVYGLWVSNIPRYVYFTSWEWIVKRDFYLDVYTI